LINIPRNFCFIFTIKIAKNPIKSAFLTPPLLTKFSKYAILLISSKIQILLEVPKNVYFSPISLEVWGQNRQILKEERTKSQFPFSREWHLSVEFSR